MGRVAWSTAVLLVLSSCGGSTPPDTQGAVTVRGTERLSWNQAGDVSNLRFRAYVDGRPADLAAATCDAATAPATCASPLPSLSDGVHTIELTSISTLSGLESERSQPPLRVQKVSGAATITTAATSRGTSGPLRLETTAKTSDGLTYTIDIVADDVRAPAQLAPLPDGRLLVAQADGRVRIVRLDETIGGAPTVALDLAAHLDPLAIGAAGLAVHPDFRSNRFVYVGFFARDRGGAAALRLVRLREVGDTLGEPLSVFETSVGAGPESESPTSIGKGSAGFTLRAPRLAFGPDRLLYVSLPAGVQFANEPAASRPVPAMIRLTEDGRLPNGLVPLSGVVGQPLAFDWQPGTRAIWVLVARQDRSVLLREAAPGGALVEVNGRDGILRGAQADNDLPGALVFGRGNVRDDHPATAFLAIPGDEALTVLTLTEPVRSERVIEGMFGRLGEVAARDDGAVFLATVNSEPNHGSERKPDVVVRLTPRQ